MYYARYDTFIVCNDPQQTKHLNFSNNSHKNIQFTMEQEKDDKFHIVFLTQMSRVRQEEPIKT